MDIPKQPINTSTTTSPRPEAFSSQTSIITDIKELKLEAGKVYSATVIQEKVTNPATSESILKADINQTTAKPEQQNLTKNEWLILLKGKAVLISSEKPLDIGQRLLLKLEHTTSSEKPVLLAQLANNKASGSLQNTSTFQASQMLNISGSTPSPDAQPLARNSAQIKLLLQALNLTLDKQLPLKQGFDQLSALTQASANALNNKVNTATLNSIKTLLLDTLPKLQDFAQTRPQANPSLTPQTNLNSQSSATNPSSTFIKNSLLNSGLLLEKTLLSEPNKLVVFKEQLASLERLIPKSTALVSPNTQQSLSALNKIQQTIESLLQLASKQTSHSSPSSRSDSATVQFNDLKANLMTASSLLSKQLAAELSATELKAFFLGAINNEAIVSPFAFPIISNANINSSKALFDKQELTTGQILKILAGMIHKLQFNQLNSLLQSNNNADAPLQQTWFFELPILNPNQTVQTFNFRIDKEPQQNPEEQGNTTEKEFKWKLLLSFDLDSLGPIYIQITLSKDSISSVLWADKESTFHLLEKESLHFKSQLENIGLKVDDLHCKKGQPNQTQTKLDRHLVDTKA